MSAKLDVGTAIQLLEFGFRAVMRWRSANGKPLDAEITADEIREIEIHDTDEAIAEGQRGG